MKEGIALEIKNSCDMIINVDLLTLRKKRDFWRARTLCGNRAEFYLDSGNTECQFCDPLGGKFAVSFTSFDFDIDDTNAGEVAKFLMLAEWQ